MDWLDSRVYYDTSFPFLVNASQKNILSEEVLGNEIMFLHIFIIFAEYLGGYIHFEANVSKFELVLKFSGVAL